LPLGDTTLYVRRIPPSKNREIERKHRLLTKRGQVNDPEQVSVFLQGVEDDRLDYALVRWDGMDGDPPCIMENKLRVPDDVREAVFRLSKSIARDMDAVQETGAKNSESPSAIATS
jgi:hypothetical protein